MQYGWMPITTYQTLGFVPTFIEVAHDFPILVPEGHDGKGASAQHPYQLYDLSDADSLVKQMESMGLPDDRHASAGPRERKRSSVYERLGFDEFLSIEDFAGAPVCHSGATDASTYDKIIELLEQDAAPQFIFDVTMQNRSGYGEGTVPSEDAV